VNKRLKNLRAKFADKGIDAVLITQAENRRYLSSFHGTAGYLLITAKKAVLATDFRYTEQAATEAPDFSIRRISGSLKDWLPALLSGLNIERLGFEGGDITFNFHTQLKAAIKTIKPAIKLVPVNNLVETLRMTKEPGEIENIRRASQITDIAFESVSAKIKSGMTEKQIAWELEKALKDNGSQGLAFDIIVGSGPNAALPHAKPSDRPVQAGETIVIDMGARVSGYASDLTRTVCVGKADVKVKKVYNAVLEAQQNTMSKIRKGMTGKEADALARDVIKAAGYGDAFGHSLGHGVGYAEHELPFLSVNSADILADGMVFTVEPGIYLTGWGGVRIEDTVVMEKGKVSPLTKAVKAKY
jgi:Xaa-Pro aminopeptidase